jgi:hypothetical protein
MSNDQNKIIGRRQPSAAGHDTSSRVLGSGNQSTFNAQNSVTSPSQAIRSRQEHCPNWRSGPPTQQLCLEINCGTIGCSTAVYSLLHMHLPLDSQA